MRVLVGGQVLTGVVQAEVRSCNHYAADSFKIVAALELDFWAGAKFWASESHLPVDVQFSLDRGCSFCSLIQGLVDVVSLNVIDGSVRLSGRDFSAGLIEARTQETFSNRTASEIAAVFAARHNLCPAVITTATPVGRYYGGSYAAATLDQFTQSTTEWDLLAYLARCERYDLSVRGSTLYFRPIADPNTPVTVIRPENLTNIMLRRNLPLARDVEVTIKSWNSQMQQGITERMVGSSCNSDVTDLETDTTSLQKYIFMRPNLTPDVALRLAQQQITELCRHERTVDLVMPGELTLSPGDVVLLDGTETEFDQTYYVELTERIMHPRRGFTQSVSLRSASPRSCTVTSSYAAP